MKNNIGTIDRFIRLIIGVVLLIVAFASNLVSGILSYCIIVCGLFLFISAVIGICPLYSLSGIKTSQ